MAKYKEETIEDVLSEMEGFIDERANKNGDRDGHDSSIEAGEESRNANEDKDASRDEREEDKDTSKKGTKKGKNKGLVVEKNGIKFTLETDKEVQDYIANEKKEKTALEHKIAKGTSREEVLLIEKAKEGDAGAVKALLEKFGVTQEDIESAEKTEVEVLTDEQQEVEDWANEVLKDEKGAEKFRESISLLPEEFANQIMNDAGMAKIFKGQVDSGVAELAIVEAAKQSAMKGSNFAEEYVKAGQRIHNDKQEEKSNNKKEGNDTDRIPGVGEDSLGREVDDIDENISDEDFRAKYLNEM
jgi:hypothetical protein